MPGAVSIGLAGSGRGVRGKGGGGGELGSIRGKQDPALRCPGGAENSEVGLVLSCVALHSQPPPAPSPPCPCVLSAGLQPHVCPSLLLVSSSPRAGGAQPIRWKHPESVTLASVLVVSPWQPAESGPSFIRDSVMCPHMLNRTCW